MTLYGLTGYPLGHSFSQRFFREKFSREGLDADYLNFEMEDVKGMLDVVRQHPNLRGFNVTIPHKQAVMALLDDIDSDAAAIGAVNTVRVEGGRLTGFNSDFIGFGDSLKPLLQPHHKKALILGTGGASKAVVYALRKMGIETMYVSRRAKEGQLTYADLTPEIMSKYTVIVNCSPVGMFPHTDECPDIPYHHLTPSHLLYDLIYNPAETLFMKRGLEQGATVKNGQEMLERQALASYDFWNSPTPNPSPKGRGEKYEYQTACSFSYGLLKAHSRRMRNNPTDGERCMWQILTTDFPEENFRRQHIIGDYIVDFVCLPKKIVIEVDGEYHNDSEQQLYDEQREKYLESKGYIILRFTNQQVIFDSQYIIDTIKPYLR